MIGKNYLTDEEYKFVYERAVRFCLDFLIVKNGEFLLVKRAIEPMKGYWSFPGGMVRRKETINQATDRILLDELGLKAKDKKLIGYIEFPDEINQHGVHVHSISIVFLTILEDGQVRGSDQAYEVKYFRNIPEKVHPLYGRFLRDNWGTITLD